MSSKVQICNMALGHIGVGVAISNFDTEQSKEAQACRLYYDQVREDVLRDFPWSFATRQATLALVETLVGQEWAFAYRYPADCLFFKRILSGARTDSRNTRVSFRVVGDADGRLIKTDAQNAVGEYTAQVLDEGEWPSDFAHAVSCLLAARIGGRLLGGDRFSLIKEAEVKYARALSKAEKNDGNEGQPDPDPDSEFISGRT